MSVEQQIDQSRRPDQAPRRRHAWRWVSIACVAFGMLIWVKLRIVTGVPRAVYADPNDSPRPVASEPTAPADDFVISGSASESMPNQHPTGGNDAPAPTPADATKPKGEGMPPRQ